MQVIKRDGRVVEFNPERIVKAVTLAMSQTPGGVDIDLANKIASSVEKQFEIVKSLLLREDIDTIYVCTDSGREGEYIYRLVEQMVGVKRENKEKSLD